MIKIFNMSNLITEIDSLDLSKSYTFADYLTWKFQERIELIKGKIFKMSPAPNRMHQTISGNLFYSLKNYILNNSNCGIYSAPFDVRLVDFKKSNNDNNVLTVVQPDICIVCDRSKLDDKGCIGSPDLVVEILSPGNTEKEMGVKFDLYEENLIKEYWIIEPVDKTIFIYTLQNNKYIGLKPQTHLDRIKSPLFPDLDIKIEEIFRD
jgi:Uma2 family endonuclease